MFKVILDKEVIVTVKPQNIEWLNNIGYKDIKCKDKVLVEVNKFKPNTWTSVKVKCDYCGKEWFKPYSEIIKSRKNIEKDSCGDCGKIKYKESMQLLYGVTNVSYLPKYREKAIQTIIDRYGDCSNLNFKRINEEDIKKMVLEKSNCKYISSEVSTKGFMKIPITLECACGTPFTTVLHEFLYDNKRQCNKCGISLRSGENHPCWKGGITSEEEKIRKSPEYAEWRKQIFEHDNYTCQCCGDNKGHNLTAHHIENFSSNEELRFDINNGITLCNDCHNPNVHGSFHNLYGTHNNTKEQIDEFIDNYNKLYFTIK